MSATYITVSQEDLTHLERRLGRRHHLCKHIRAALDDLDNQAFAAYRAAAMEQSSEGELEIDPGAVVAQSDDDGAYVMAWLWVSDDEAGLETEGAS
jgi:hypothetical protein